MCLFSLLFECITLYFNSQLDHQPNDELVTPLSAAAAAGHLDAVNELLMYGADVNAADRMGITPFFTACAQGHTQVVESMQEYFEGTCDVNKVWVRFDFFT